MRVRVARVFAVAAVAAAGCAHPNPGEDGDSGAHRVDLAGRDLRGLDLSHSSSADLSSGGQCPGKDLQTDPMNCGVCGMACKGAHVMTNACMGGTCAVGLCAAGFFDVDAMAADGCECPVEASETMASSQCAGAATAGEVTDAMASMITLSGNIVPLTDEDWYQVKSTDDPDDVSMCNKYHLQIKFADNPKNQFRFDLLYDDCSTKASCGGMGEGPAGLTEYDFDSNGAMDGGECPCATGKPMAGQHQCMDHSQTVRIRVYRAMNLPLTCDNYKLLVLNGM